jgi:hypothetical protein
VDLYGIEFDWQTHLWYLPNPFTGLVLSVNYTHTYSNTKYPQVVTTLDPNTYQVTHSISYFSSRILDQPDNILNLAVGYDYEGFSARVSLLYQADIFKQVNFWPELRYATDKQTRWDLSVKQKLPWFGVQAFFDINNINGAQDVSLDEGNNYPSSIQDYGMSADFGFRVTF